MSLVTTGGIAASIVPFDPTYGVTIVATAMLAVFMLAMVFFAVAPVVSSTWSERLGTDGVAAAAPADGRATASDTREDRMAAATSQDDRTTASRADTAEAEEPTASSGTADAELADGAVSDDALAGGAGSVTEGTFTDDELGKLVERADGKVIGTVAEVGGDRARVEPRPDALDQLLVRLGRAEVGDAFVLEEGDVDEISATRIHLEREFVRPTGGAASGTDGATAATE
ncbi:hypothetical protein GWG54_13010 [Natronococcus sp. JC468]|uniref:hypothetical protein n=1 Tax=Natronococcus sp. JC468 TaxID=1961921 RepID=UPI0014393D07|nr:hypothetical protein [Natronococcus sp. JC468]NKE36720.1 hypothetical protein [Natronococcus sp. JC468]